MEGKFLNHVINILVTKDGCKTFVKKDISKIANDTIYKYKICNLN